MSMPYVFGKIQDNLSLILSLWAFFVLTIESCRVDDLPIVPHAQPTENEPQYDHGRSVAYKCDTGFKAANGTNNAVCLREENGILRWGTPTLLCVPEDCNEPPDLFNAGKGQVEGKSPPYPVGSQAKYNCLIGFYKHEGTDAADCIRDRDGKAKWTRPTLDCRPEHCGDPGVVKHAERSGHLFTFSNSVTYTCVRGYNTNDKKTLYCLPGGAWSDRPPVCEIIHCPEPIDPANGQVRFQDTTYLSVAVYSCSSGYKLLGDRERHCTGEKTWSGTQPACKEVHCEPFTVSPGSYVVHGNLSAKPGDLVVMKCKYSDERRTLKCMESGEWSSPPLMCDVPPQPTVTTISSTTTTTTTRATTNGERLMCDDPGVITHGSLIESQQTQNFPTDTNLTFQCDPGYDLNGHATLHCLPSGKWEPSRLPACDKIVPIGYIVGFLLGGLFLVVLALVTLGLFFRKRKRKAQNAVCLKRKANSIDARDIEETCCLEKEKKPIPVTSL